MLRWTIAYTSIAIWVFGWLAGRYGILPSFLAALIFFTPAVFAWRILASERTVKRREYAYLGLVTALAVVATTFVVCVGKVRRHGGDYRCVLVCGS